MVFQPKLRLFSGSIARISIIYNDWAKHTDCNLIVNGDDTLNDPKFLEAIGDTEKDVIRIDPELLTPELFKGIMKTRLNAIWKLQQINKTVGSAPFGDIPAIITELQRLNKTERYTDDVMDSLFDPDFLKAMLLRTEYPVTEIRGSLVLLAQISRQNIAEVFFSYTQFL